eukprot:836767-Alexandrium_andersonii.AAC.1
MRCCPSAVVHVAEPETGGRASKFGGFNAFGRIRWPFGEALTAGSSSWALAPDPSFSRGGQ